MSSSSRVLRAPPMSARWREAATGRMPERGGVPLRTIMAQAAEVSLWSRATSSGSVKGRRARQRSFPSSVAAWAAKSSSTRGSSRVWMDFSNKSVITISPKAGIQGGVLRQTVCVLRPHTP